MDLGLSVYKFTINHKRKKQPINLSAPINGNSMFEQVGSLLANDRLYVEQNTKLTQKMLEAGKEATREIHIEKCHSESEEDCPQKTFSEIIQKENKPYYQYIYLTLDGGDKGDSADVKERNDKNEFQTVYQITNDQIVSRYFQVFIAMPCAKNVYAGALIFLNIGRHGVKGIFEPVFKKAISDAYRSAGVGEVTVKISPLSNLESIEKLLDTSPFEQIKLVKSMEKDNAICKRQEKILISPNKSYFLNIIKEVFRSKSVNQTGVVEIDGFEPTDLRVTVDVGNGKTKTIAMTKTDVVSLVEYITNDSRIEYDDNRRIKAGSLEPIFHEVFLDYIEYLNKLDETSAE